ncbi:MAG: hypothetical protein JOY99_11750 [Sphingomonadaceae bacterium]|nr:hypothetical protein [Sphingomonadaceae bacterium]
MADIDGTWDCVSQSPMGEQKSVLTLATAPDGSVTGRNQAAMGGADVTDGRVDGDQLRFRMEVRVPFPITMDCAASIEGDAMTGSITVGAFGSFPMHAKRRG